MIIMAEKIIPKEDDAPEIEGSVIMRGRIVE
jgi:hypothetical protein